MQELFIVIQPGYQSKLQDFVTLKDFPMGKLMLREYFTDFGRHISFKSPRQ